MSCELLLMAHGLWLKAYIKLNRTTNTNNLKLTMKRKLFLIACFSILCSMIYGQNHWMPDEPIPEGSMSAIMCVKICGDEQMRTDLELAAFHDGKVRSESTRGQIVDVDGKERVLYIITILGDKKGEEITFKLYDPIADKEYYCSYNDIVFKNNAVLGMDDATGAFDPITLNFYHWNYEYDYSWNQSMTIVSKVQINGVDQDRTNLEIAAFCREKLCGVSHPTVINGKKLLYLQIQGNDDDVDEPVSFKLYDHGGEYDEILLSDYTELFENNKVIGSSSNPQVINFISKYVAKIGTTKFETLQAAVEAAQEDDVITILRDAESEEPVVVNKDITIDFAGFTYDGALNLKATLDVVGTAGKVTSIVLNEGAQVYHNYALETTIVRNIAGTTSGWGTLSAPTAEGDVEFNTTGTHDFYQYVEYQDLEWDYIPAEDNTYEMEVGRGYLYANEENVVASFTGTLNMKAVKYALGYTADKELSGLNMIGNPFTHNINVNHLDGEIAEAFYSVDTSGAWVPNVEGSVIAPLQAVLVQTNVADTLAINKEATRTRAASEGSLKINVANKNYNDVAYVLFKEGLGLSKIAHFNTEIPMVSVNVEGKEYAVATMNKEVTEIPVSFKAMTMGEYTISVEAQDVEETIYLTDKLTGERVNLNTDSYTFMATSNDNTDRFVLTKVLDTTGIEQNAECSVYVSNDEIRFNNLNGNLNVRIYDMLGRPVAEYNVFESAIISTSSFETGMYILQMTDENGVRTQKVLVD